MTYKINQKREQSLLSFMAVSFVLIVVGLVLGFTLALNVITNITELTVPSGKEYINAYEN